jgi:hypothetical protein
MDDDDLAAATALFYENTDRWLDEDLTTSGLAEWEAAAVDRWFPDTGRILIPAAGAGREVLPLVTAGYDVVGFDPSQPLVDLGNHLLTATGTRGALLVAPPNTIPTDIVGPFDAALFGWGGISHVRGRSTRINLLTDIRALMVDGAPLLISFLHRDPDARSFATVCSVATSLQRIRRTDTTVEVGDTVNGSFDHYFTMDEMAAELASSGFTEVARSTSPYAHIVAVAS